MSTENLPSTTSQNKTSLSEPFNADQVLLSFYPIQSSIEKKFLVVLILIALLLALVIIHSYHWNQVNHYSNLLHQHVLPLSKMESQTRLMLNQSNDDLKQWSLHSHSSLMIQKEKHWEKIQNLQKEQTTIAKNWLTVEYQSTLKQAHEYSQIIQKTQKQIVSSYPPKNTMLPLLEQLDSALKELMNQEFISRAPSRVLKQLVQFQNELVQIQMLIRQVPNQNSHLIRFLDHWKQFLDKFEALPH